MIDIHKIDIIEEELLAYDKQLLEILLRDRSTGSNIVWATEDYQDNGEGFGKADCIRIDKITGEDYKYTIRPRSVKSVDQQKLRARKKAEVFTPSWLCNKQNNLVDRSFWGRNEVFNVETKRGWHATKEKIAFPTGKSWKDYVLNPVIEITCGEAPYLVSRYDTTTGERIEPAERIGLIDRKIRVINEHVDSEADWLKWAIKAVEHSYGFELQGDNLLIARENILFSFWEYYYQRFSRYPETKILRKVAEIISWNIWQMDGLKPEAAFPGGADRVTFGYVVGNPPYQDQGGAGGNNDAPIYQHFCKMADRITNSVSSLVIKASWFSAGRDNLLGDFRRSMLTSGKVKRMVVYADSRDIFLNVEIKGGICYYLKDKNAPRSRCEYTIYKDGKEETLSRDLDDFDILIRDPMLNSIVKQVYSLSMKEGAEYVDKLISADTPFGIPSNPRTSVKTPFCVYENGSEEHDVLLYHIEKLHRKIEYCSVAQIRKNVPDIDCDKVFVPCSGGSGNDRMVLGYPELAPKHSVCSQSYLYAKFPSAEEAANFMSYMKTKFFRVLVSAIKITQACPKKTYRFVPVQDFTKSWADEELYDKYGLTASQREYIEQKLDKMI